MTHSLKFFQVAVVVMILSFIWAIIDINLDPVGTANPKNSLENPPVQKSNRRYKLTKRNRTVDARTTDELRLAFLKLIPPHGETLFDEKEMIKFVESLNHDEAERLAEEILSRKSYPTLATAFLFYRWGQFDPLNALATLEAYQVEGTLLKHHIHAGWLKLDAIAAFSHHQKTEQSGYELLNRIGNNWAWRRCGLWETIADLDSQFAIELLAELSSEGGALQISPAERDEVVRRLPENSDWRRLWDLFLNHEFTSDHDQFVFRERGLGGALFARWANEDVDSALQWFRERHPESDSDRSSDHPTTGQLVASWYGESPELAGAWIKNQISSDPNGEIISVLEEQIPHQLPDRNWLSWSQYLPDESRRFDILRSAAQPSSTSYLRLVGGGSEVQENYGIDKDTVETMVGQFNLTEEHAEEIRQILRSR